MVLCLVAGASGALVWGCERSAPPAATSENGQDRNGPAFDTDESTAEEATPALPDGPEVVRRHVLAAGGAEVPPDGASRTFTYDIHFTVPGAAERRIDEPTGSMIVRRKAPNRLRTTTTIDAIGETHGGFDGSVGWALDGTNLRMREDRSLAELAREAVFDREIHLDLVYPTAKLLGEVNRDGVDCWHVALNAEDGTLAHAFFNKSSGLLFELVRQLDSPAGPMGVVHRYVQWTEFDGRKFPKRIENRMGGTVQTMILVDVDDTPLDDDLFAVPTIDE